MDLFLTNTLTRKKEKFEAISPPDVGLYTCGMTVYDYAHIGHGRKYVTDDLLKRVLVANGYKVKHVQNVTDVGHLVSDEDEGEDKLEKGAQKSGKTVWEVADYFTKNFYDSMDKLNIIRPDIICRATDHIKEQVALTQKLIEKGFAYDTPEAVYFDTTKFDTYGELSGQKQEEKRVAVRSEVKTGEHKKHPSDFALWFKRVGRFKDHTMHWDAPWGDGFPGWHIECSAMGIKYLGEQFDIHTGGEDHIPVHHTNEIAQSEAATGKRPFVKYWLHYAFLMVDGKKMSKSLGNFYTIEDIEKKGFNPISLRYLYLSAHYRDPLNFTWESLEAAQNGLEKLKGIVAELRLRGRSVLSQEKNSKVDGFRSDFMAAVNDDLNTSKAMAVVWEMLKSSIPNEDKYDLAMTFDEILGLGLGLAPKTQELTEEIKSLIKEREDLRTQGKFDEADIIREKLEKIGYQVKDKAL
jgi:cysteinyl-tRNA synthetase